MAEAVKSKLVSARTKLLRRTSGFSEPSSTASTSSSPENEHPPPKDRHLSRRKASIPIIGRSLHRQKHESPSTSVATTQPSSAGPPTKPVDIPVEQPKPPRPPTLTLQQPSSPLLVENQRLPNGRPLSSNNQLESEEHPDPQPTSSAPSSRAHSARPPLTRASTTASYYSKNAISNTCFNRGVVQDSDTQEPSLDVLHLQNKLPQSYHSQPSKMSTPVQKRKVWVRRPNASATLVQYTEDDLVDDVRDTILTKYRNSLGKSFDSPDVTLKIQPRERSNHAGHDRTLGPEEPMSRTLDAYFPGGQDVAEALIIDVPHRRTPRASPRIVARPPTDHYEGHQPAEDDGDYFGPMPVAGPGGQLTPQERRRDGAVHHPHAISILETGQAPALPSPRGEKRRPKPRREHTSSPTIMNSTGTSNSGAATGYVYGHTHTPKQTRNRRDSNDRIKGPSHAPAPPPMPGSPSPEVAASGLLPGGHKVATPPAGQVHPSTVTSPRLSKPKKTRKSSGINGHRDLASAAGIERAASVPPINVLIVEDNIINLRLMEMFVGRLKVRWGTAMNGREAVTKWRAGGYHLVLMDLQMPIMNGLDATKEIRRLERVNGIGVFADGDGDGTAVANGDVERRPNKDAKEEDQLSKGELFKSPVIIVALTASSLQSDRREALAAGCNDFLTKVCPPYLSYALTKA